MKGSKESASELVTEIRSICSQPWTLMEVCGGQTHALLRHGIDQLLDGKVRLVHGPGCPVCVTAIERIDEALELASNRDVILCSYGDMLRVPGSDGRDLLSLRRGGADIRIIYTPLDVMRLAEENPKRRVIFFAVGFETTAPATAILVQQTMVAGFENLQVLMAHVRVGPVLDQLLAEPSCAVNGLIAAGHVCTVMGEGELWELAKNYQRPVVITGFEAEELLEGILECVQQLEQGRYQLANAYPRAVRRNGNQMAQKQIKRVMEPVDTIWRGLGNIPVGGYRLRYPFDRLAVESRAEENKVANKGECPSALVLQGLLRPSQCEYYGSRCTPDAPMGAPMVSGEGACAAYYRYQR